MGKYSKIFLLAMSHSLKNYKALIGLSIFLVTCLLIFAHIWQMATARFGVSTLHADQLLWYIALNEWLLISTPDVQEEMAQDLRSGRLAYLLPRPISYLNSIFFEGLGLLTTNLLVLGVVTFAFTWFRIGHLTFVASALPLIIGTTVLAGVVALIFRMIIGLSAFWLRQVEPFYWIWEKLLFTLGGLMLPLAVYPLWLQKIAYFTPFPSLLGQRSALAIDFTIYNFLHVTSILLFWGLFGATLLFFLYKRGLRIVNIEGG